MRCQCQQSRKHFKTQFADYQGVKALDHDDGSSFFFDHSNVIYMGWGQKTFEPAPGNKTASDSLILFTSSVLTEHGGETSAKYAEKFVNNTIVFKPGQAHYGSVDSEVQLTQPLLQLQGTTSLPVGGFTARTRQKRHRVS